MTKKIFFLKPVRTRAALNLPAYGHNVQLLLREGNAILLEIHQDELLTRQRFRGISVTPQKNEILTVSRESWLLLSLVMCLWDACQVPK